MAFEIYMHTYTEHSNFIVNKFVCLFLNGKLGKVSSVGETNVPKSSYKFIS